MAEHLLIIFPSPKRCDADTKASGRFDGYFGGDLLVERTYTPFCDGARALLAGGICADDVLVMRHAGSGHDALRSTVGYAARLTVSEANGPPQFRVWRPMPSRAIAG